MPSSLTVLWPKVVAPDIEELRFSYDFCGRLSKQLCKEASPGSSWVEYTGDQAIEELLPLIDTDMALVVTEPEIVISPSAVKGLTKCLETGYGICGPVYNQTTFPHQTAPLPVPYVDMGTYLEMAAALAEREESHHVAADTLDPACVLYRVMLLKELPEQTLFSDAPGFIAKMRSNISAVATCALVHRGFKNDFERDDLVRLVPEGVKRVLDMGCAMGGYGRTLKQLYPDIFLTGVELNPIMAQSAGRYYDEIIRCHAEEANLAETFDLVNCGDFLEHLRDPWRMLKQIHRLLRHDGGYLVISIPNVGHWSIVRDLLQGRFQYVPSGLLCVTHLRWFTESSIRTALADAGFSIEVFQREHIPPTPRGEQFISQMCTTGYGDEKS
ncbi:MAG: class I SAM-dependent methyltransferase, partial [Pseudomonadota bacterium]